MATPSLLRKMGDKASTYGTALKSLAPDENELKGLKAVQDNVNQEADFRKNGPPVEKPATSTPSPADRLNPRARYGSKTGEQRIPDNELKEMSHPLGTLPVYDGGGNVDANYQRIMSVPTGATKVGAQRIPEFDDSPVGRKKPLSDTFKGGSVGNSADPALAHPQYMPGQEPSMTPPVDMLQLPNSAFGNKLPVYDDGGEVDVNDGKHQLAVLQDGEKVLNPEEAQQYDQAQGAPADFGGRVIPNPDNVQPHEDTEPLETERIGGGARMNTDNAPLKTPKGDVSNPPAADVNPEMMQESSVKSEGIKPRLDPNSPAGKMIQQDKVAAAQKGDLVGMGTALLNEKHLAPTLPIYGGPGEKVPQGDAIPQDQIHHDRIASYDQRIQDALDKAAQTNDPAYQEQADRLKVAKLQYQKSTPYGSDTNHPGILGRIGHVAAKVGNIAGDIVAPETMALIPGTQLNKGLQSNKLGSALKEETASNLAQQEERYKENALEVGKTPEQRTYSYYIRQGLTPDKALEMTKGDEAKEKESYINDAMKQPNATTGKSNTREEATQQYYQMRAGVKPANPKEQELQDHLKQMKLADTPENRDLARNDLQRRKTDTAQAATLPYAEQKIRLQSSLAEAKSDLDRTGNDALQRGVKADEFALKENERHNLRTTQIESAQNALDMSDTNALAASITPVLATMTESNAQGLKRLNPQELGKFMPKSSGDAKQWFEANYDKITAGQIPEQYRGDLKELLVNLTKEEAQQNQANLSAIDGTLRQGAVTPKVNPKGKANTTEKSKPAAPEALPTAEHNQYHMSGAKGEIVSNDGKTWYDLKGNKVGK